MEERLEQTAARVIQQAAPGFTPYLGLVLGSGLNQLAKAIENPITIPFDHIPGFPAIHVSGHVGELILGYLNGTPVACLRGRCHPYETNDYTPVKVYTRTLQLLGCEIFLATNAAGSLQESVTPGNIVLIEDHINWQPSNPLVGLNDDDVGPRFLPLDDAYDRQLRETMQAQAKQLDIKLAQGVYLSVLGPTYETAAEIRAFKMLGADVVGMSTVPEVIVARHCGMKVIVLSIVTNMATGLTQVSHDHARVVQQAEKASNTLSTLITAFAKTIYASR